jgi:hypothetical protein
LAPSSDPPHALLGQAPAAETQARVEALATDPWVIPERVGQQADVGAGGLAHLRDRVDERNLGREKRVRRNLDQFRGLQVGHQEGHAGIQQRPVQLADRRLGACRIVLHAEHDAVRVQGVVHGQAFAQELGVPGDLDVHAPGRERDGPGGQRRRGAHRNRRLADEHRRPRQPRHQRIDDGVDVAQVSGVFALLLRRADPQKVHVGELGRHVVVGGEPKPTGSQIVLQQLSQARLVERNVTTGELGDLARIDVDPNDVMAQFRHPDRVGGAQVTGAEDGTTHTSGVGARDERTASAG